MTDKTEPEQRPAHLFAPGESGNPKGRPKGSRSKLGEAFIADLYDDWMANGVETIAKVRDERPDVYVKVVASILPKDLNVNVNDMGDVTDDELIKRIRDIDAAIRPFLAAQGETADSEGGRPQTAH